MAIWLALCMTAFCVAALRKASHSKGNCVHGSIVYGITQQLQRCDTWHWHQGVG